VALTAVWQQGLALQHASPELRADRDVVEAAVRCDRHALNYCAPELREDVGVVETACAPATR